MDSYKCKIVTFHKAINYGAVLQAYALKTALDVDCPTCVYNHDNKYIKQFYSINPFKSKQKKAFLKKVIYFLPSAVKKYRFNKFVRKYLIKDTTKTEKEFYISGSDQVWNYICSDFDKAYFLDFAKDEKLKNSFSASFGFDEIPENYLDEYKRLLQNYNFMSVREEAGRKIVKDLLDRDVPVTIDPTFLLDKKEWGEKFCKRNIKGKYILVYAFYISKNMHNFIDRLSSEKNLPIIVLMPNKSFFGTNIKGAAYKSYVSPEQWVNYMYNAEYVVTNSFHGTAFSINFNKKFFVELKSESEKMNSRVTHILETLKVGDRHISDDIDLDSVIDYETVNAVLKEKCSESKNYLKQIVDSYK